MNNLKKRRTSVLIGLALMGLSVHAYAVDVTASHRYSYYGSIY